ALCFGSSGRFVTGSRQLIAKHFFFAFLPALQRFQSARNLGASPPFAAEENRKNGDDSHTHRETNQFISSWSHCPEVPRNRGMFKRTSALLAPNRTFLFQQSERPGRSWSANRTDSSRRGLGPRQLSLSINPSTSVAMTNRRARTVLSPRHRPRDRVPGIRRPPSNARS